jgi:SpoIID/LytB domain protein
MPRGRAIGSCLIAVAAAVGTLGVPRAGADVPVVVVTGKGWGHGVGMAQDGALEMGLQGDTLGQILGQFYPGTTMGQARGDVRVAVLGAGAAPASATVTFPDGGSVVDTLSGQHAPGFPRPVPAGGSAVFTWDGTTYTVSTTPMPAAVGAASVATPVPAPVLLPTIPALTPHPTTTTTTRAPARTARSKPHRQPTTTIGGATTTAVPPTTAPPDPPLTSAAPMWALSATGGVLGVPGRGRTYRGMIEADGSSGALELVNQLDVETYLTGMGEVLDPAWPLASLETQEIAARTYALRAMATAGQLCDDTRCQVYLGVAGEYPAAEQAVADTAGEVLLSGGQLADTVYSANAGGYSASTEEGFGVADTGDPYLRPAPYPTGNPLPWSVSIAASAAGAALGLPGPVTAVSVTSRGPSGRALTLSVQSGATTATVSGLAFAADLDLRSTMIDVRMGQSESTPAPISTAYALQVPANETGHLAPAAAALAVPRRLPFAAPQPELAATVPRSRPGLPWGLVAVAVLLLLGTASAVARAGGAPLRGAPPNSNHLRS